METIDQRILIPAPPDVVWAVISDMQQNPSWMENCEGVAFLTQNHQGPGTRWRSTLRKGHDAIVQVTAWYNGLGYEYTYIDGMPYKQNVGRIRLQEIPEGTVVQWTFSYEPKGMFKGVRQVEGTIADSLRTLYKLMQDKKDRRPLEAKSLMRDDPGVEARSTYKPRHPSEIKSDTPAMPVSTQYEPPIGEDDNRHIPVVNRLAAEEPPVAEHDTRPRPPVQVPPAAPARPSFPTLPPVVDEPDFLSDLDAKPNPADARFMPPTRIEEPPIAEHDTRPRPAVEAPPTPTSSDEPDFVEPVKPLEIPPPRNSDPFERIEETPPPPRIEPSRSVRVDQTPPPFPSARPPVQAPASPPHTPVEPAHEESEPASNVPDAIMNFKGTEDLEDDTASIWEIFGLPRPSATQELRALQLKEAAQKPERPEEVQPPRMGLRTFQRRRIVSVRRPENK